MAVTTTIKSPNELQIIFKPNYKFFLLAALALALQALIAIAISNLWYMSHWFLLIWCSAVLWFSFLCRDVSTVINLFEKSVRYEKGGLFNSSVFSFEETYNTADLSSIRIARGTKNKSDWFEIKLFVNQSKSLPLAFENFSLEDTYQIRDFIGTHIPIVTVG
jgi:hypothetical protein